MSLLLTNYNLDFVEDNNDSLGGQLQLKLHAKDEQHHTDATRDLAHAMYVHRPYDPQDETESLQSGLWYKHGRFCEFLFDESNGEPSIILRERAGVAIKGGRDLDRIDIPYKLQFEGVVTPTTCSEFMQAMRDSELVKARRDANNAAALASMNAPRKYMGTV
ncbi:hypothetical protein [Larkinella humicola]|uniref:Uncharacterized protein n=1 Tax=Larkinella humicola TaxID=2607654 RepID=A0A5N1JDW5_9BACT|nr:hypothetical protein [Larkinella humicola]KAA9349246.1 hypothetical protein F0P93_22900 [Larkinella humicola]